MNKNLMVFSIVIVIVCISMILGYEKLIVSPTREEKKELASRVVDNEKVI